VSGLVKGVAHGVTPDPPEPTTDPDDCFAARVDGYATTCGHPATDHQVCGCCPTRHRTTCTETRCPRCGPYHLPWCGQPRTTHLRPSIRETT